MPMPDLTPEEEAFYKVVSEARAYVEKCAKSFEKGKPDCRVDCENPPIRNTSEPAEDILGSEPVGDGQLEIEAVDISLDRVLSQ